MKNPTTHLRPTKWIDFIGQDQVVKSLKIGLKASSDRKEPLEHILLYGPPGLGKTTLANLISYHLGVNLKVTSGPALTRAGDLASILTNLEKGDILFIDEIHRLNKTVEEALYPAMEEFCLDMILGKGPAARTLRLELNPFTIIGATTKAGSISNPLRDRFGIVHRLKFYQPEDLQTIIIKTAKRLGFSIDKESALEIGKRSRGTARIAQKLLRRVRDYAQVQHKSQPNLELTRQCLEFYQVDNAGLDEIDRLLLTAIIKQYEGGPVGVKTLASIVSEDTNTITDVYEPFLIQTGFLSKNPRGRMATPKAYQHLNLKQPKKTV